MTRTDEKIAGEATGIFDSERTSFCLNHVVDLLQ